MYRKNRASCLQKSCQVGWVAGLSGRVFGVNSKTPKNFIKCLIFNDLTLWSSLWSGFGVALEFFAHF